MALCFRKRAAVVSIYRQKVSKRCPMKKSTRFSGFLILLVGVFLLTLPIIGAPSVHSQSGCPVITLFPPALPDVLAGAPYRQTIRAAGGIAPYTFSSTALPAGLILDPIGVLSGTPTMPGTFTFTITATDANNCSGSRDYT